MNVTAIIMVFILLIALMGLFSQDKVDYFPFALIIGAVAVLYMTGLGGLGRLEVLGFIKFETLIFIFAIQIVIHFATTDRVLEYIGVKIIHLTKGNNRLFFVMICLLTGVLVAFIEDLTLSLILVPLIYKTCKVLNIPAGSYMMGMTIIINVGAVITPVSSIKNLIIAQEFGWGFAEYFFNMGFIFAANMALTIFLMDWFYIRKEQKPSEENKEVLLAMLYPKLVIRNKKYFNVTSATLVAMFVVMGIGPMLDQLLGVELFDPATISLVAAAFLMLVHWKDVRFTHLKKEITWRIIIVFAILFILSNSLAAFGFSEFISMVLAAGLGGNTFLAVLIVLGISSAMSALLAGTPVTIILLPIFSAFIQTGGFLPHPVIIAFIAGINLSGNFLPQGSECDLLTLSLAKRYEVENLDYKRLLKTGALFATIHTAITLAYTMVYILVIPFF